MCNNLSYDLTQCLLSMYRCLYSFFFWHHLAHYPCIVAIWDHNHSVPHSCTVTSLWLLPCAVMSLDASFLSYYPCTVTSFCNVLTLQYLLYLYCHITVFIIPVNWCLGYPNDSIATRELKYFSNKSLKRSCHVTKVKDVPWLWWSFFSFYRCPIVPQLALLLFMLGMPIY